jgi:hypothetical protein
MIDCTKCFYYGGEKCTHPEDPVHFSDKEYVVWCQFKRVSAITNKEIYEKFHCSLKELSDFVGKKIFKVIVTDESIQLYDKNDKIIEPNEPEDLEQLDFL